MILLQGVRASVRPDEAQRKVKEWQENFKAYQNALQRLSVSSSVLASASNSSPAIVPKGSSLSANFTTPLDLPVAYTMSASCGASDAASSVI
jgi:predicted  nucleic acid-binding Zn ribbon protein